MRRKLIQVSTIFIIAVLCFCRSQKNQILFKDPLDGTVIEDWIVAPDSFIVHPNYGRIYNLKCNNVRLNKDAPWVGNESWENYRIEIEILIAEKKGFIGLDYHMQNQIG